MSLVNICVGVAMARYARMANSDDGWGHCWWWWDTETSKLPSLVLCLESKSVLEEKETWCSAATKAVSGST